MPPSASSSTYAAWLSRSTACIAPTSCRQLSESAVNADFRLARGRSSEAGVGRLCSARCRCTASRKSAVRQLARCGVLGVELAIASPRRRGTARGAVSGGNTNPHGETKRAV